MQVKGFTLIELILVVVILGVLAAIAIPKVTGPNEQIRSSEGQQILSVLLGAQKRYNLENGSYATAIASLDVDLPSLSNFSTVNILNGGTSNEVASVVRTGGAYSLCIDTS